MTESTTIKYVAKNPILVISLAFNLLFILSATLFTGFFYNLQQSSQVGDSVGGIIGTIVSSVAMFYAYKAFVDQRKNFFEQRSVALYTDLLSSIRNATDSLNNIIYVAKITENNQTFEKEFRGSAALQNYGFRDPGSYFVNFTAADRIFFHEMFIAFSELVRMAERYNSIKSLLTETHSDILFEELMQPISETSKAIDEIFELILEFGKEFSEINRPDYYMTNLTLEYVAYYQTLSRRLTKLGYKKTTFRQDAQQVPFAWNTPLNTELLQSISWDDRFENR